MEKNIFHYFGSRKGVKMTKFYLKTTSYIYLQLSWLFGILYVSMIPVLHWGIGLGV